MKKESLIARSEQLRIRAEDGDEEVRGIIKLELLDLFLEYINNQEVREKVEEIPL